MSAPWWQQGKEATITCEGCGYRNRLERRLRTPERVWIVCHQCESPLWADVLSEGGVIRREGAEQEKR